MRLPEACRRQRAQLLTLAVGTKQLLNQRQRRVALPTVSRDVLEKFYPLLADYIIEVRPPPRLPYAAPRSLAVRRAACAVSPAWFHRSYAALRTGQAGRRLSVLFKFSFWMPASVSAAAAVRGTH